MSGRATFTIVMSGMTASEHPPNQGVHVPDSNFVASLDAQLAVLGLALAAWNQREDTRPQPEIRMAANTAMAAIDDQLATLHKLRQQLLTEIRKSDDATAARVDALLAARRTAASTGDAR
jgi:hypothetical protein